MQDTTFLTDAQIMARYHFSAMSLWRWRANRGFPKGSKLGGGRNLTPVAEVLAWESKALEARNAERGE